MPEYTSARIKLPTKAFIKEFKKTHKNKSEDDIINLWRLGYLETEQHLTEIQDTLMIHTVMLGEIVQKL